MKFRTSLLSSVALAAAFTVSTGYEAAQAQEFSIEEITVTARKREENLQDIPLSITAFSADSLKQRNITTVYELSANTPNFVTTPQLGRRLDRPTFRGQAGTLVRGEPNASYFIDGVFISGSATTSTFNALERVEVLRGPQSALFGRATFAGAVNLITRDPTNEHEGQFNARIGSHETYEAAGWLSGPVVEDKLLYFVSASWDQYGGEWKNDLAANEAAGDSIFIPFPPPGRTINFVTGPTRADSSDLGGEENTDATIKFIFKPAESHELEFKFNYAGGRDDHFPALLVDNSELNCFRPGIDANAGPLSAGYFCGELTAGDRTSKLNIPDLVDGGTRSFFGVTAEPSPIGAGIKRDIFRLLTQYTGDFNGWEAVARATWNRDRFKSGRDLDRSSFRPVFGLFTAYEEDNTEDWAGELRFTSPQDEPLRGLFGGYYFEKRFWERDPRFSGPGGAGQFIATGYGLCTTSPATFDPGQCDAAEEDVTNYAVFASVDYDVTEQLTLSAEARYSKDEKTVRGAVVTDAEAAALTGALSALDVASIQDNRLVVQDDTKDFTPRVTLTYKPNDDMTVYGLVAKGDKPLDFNLAFFDDDTDPNDLVSAVADGRAVINAESAWTYEAGLKSTLADGRARLNVSGFYIDWKNQAVSSVEDILLRTGELETNNTVRSAPGARVVGLEIEASWTPTDNLLMTAGYGLADHKFTKTFIDARVAALTGGTGDVDGNTTPSTPKHNANLSATYRDTFGNDSDWFVRSFLNYESKKFANVANLAWVGDRWNWNAQVGVEAPQWRLTLYVDNILDDNTPRTVSLFTDFRNESVPGVDASLFTLNPQRGRDFGVRAQYSF